MHTGPVRLLAGLFVVVTAGCGGGGGGSDSGGSGPEALDRYALANECFAVRSVGAQAFVMRDGGGRYAAGTTGRSAAEAFYMKPTALGKYMFYAPDESLLVASGGGTDRLNAPSDGIEWGVDATAEWTVDRNGGGHFTVVSEATDRALAVDPDTGRLALASPAPGDSAQQFAFAAADGCADFPEIGVQATGETYEGTGVDEPVLGFADIHNHVGATDFLGGDHVGRPFHRFGVTEALGDGAYVHGENGHLDLVGNFYTGRLTEDHDTQGWPRFNDWPARDMLTHEGTYYRWIKRAWLAGLRVLNNLVVENQVLCTVQSLVQQTNNLNLNEIDLTRLRDALAGPLGEACNEMDNAIEQIAFMRRMEAYIDAQNGGPGEGWFRIVESPDEARAVINEGKLAVYLGIEVSHLFGCDLFQLGGLGPGRNGCTREDIDAQLDRLHELGVRQVNVIHEFNNALGGNGIFNDFILNVGNFVDTGSFWETRDCSAIAEDDEFLYAPGANLVSGDPLAHILPGSVLSELLGGIAQGVLPVYPTDERQCNARGLTALGRYAVERIMDRRMLIDVDHLSLKMKSQVIEIAQQRDPDYPLISTHGGHGGISNQQAKAIFGLGGLIYPMSHDAETVVEDLERTRALASEEYEFAMGYGADTNGLATQPSVRGGDTEPVTYPFALFQGPEWGPRFDRVAAVTFEQSAVPEGDRRFDINTEGVAHYGLFADWVKSIEIAGGRDSLDALYNSAEVFLRTWERAVDR